MKDMIEALQIFLKYTEDSRWPFSCDHDVFYVVRGPDRDRVSDDDAKRLDELGFLWSDEDEHWYSFRFGSC